jgi:predicted alpha/beta-hydrolase family hydrolase
MLFLQGTRDALADPALLRPIVARLGERARLVEFDDADHSFHVRARSGRTDAEVLDGIAEALNAWVDEAILHRGA